MFRYASTQKFYAKTVFHTFLLSFLSGSVNVGGFMACGRFVTHVTGFASIFGMDMVLGDWMGALGILTVPIYFFLGSMVAGYLVDRHIHQGRQPNYALVMGLIMGALLVAALGGFYHFFGLFGEGIDIKQDYLLLSILCGASGLQNATITTSSSAVIRTTHLTGMTTDLGIGLVRVLFPLQDQEHLSREIRMNWLRVVIIGAFMLGSLVGAGLFLKFQYLGFVLPALIACYLMVVNLRLSGAHPEPK